MDYKKKIEDKIKEVEHRMDVADKINESDPEKFKYYWLADCVDGRPYSENDYDYDRQFLYDLYELLKEEES